MAGGWGSDTKTTPTMTCVGLLGMAMAAAPSRIDPAAVRSFLAGQPGVDGVHDLHIWAMSTTEVALTCHLVMPGGHPGDGFLHRQPGAVLIRVDLLQASGGNRGGLLILGPVQEIHWQ